MIKFKSFTPNSPEAEYLVSTEENAYLEMAVRFYSDYLVSSQFPNEEMLTFFHRLLIYLDENPQFILSDYYDRITVDL